MLASSEFAEPFTLLIAQLPNFLAGCFFAKYDIPAAIRKKFAGNFIYSLVAAVVLLILFLMRKTMGPAWDFVIAPVMVCVCTIILHTRGMKWLYAFLQKIGKESTVIWLTHTIYCYLLIPGLIYSPRYSVLIAAFLLVLCYVTSVGIRWLYKGLLKIGTFLYGRLCFEEK